MGLHLNHLSKIRRNDIEIASKSGNKDDTIKSLNDLLQQNPQAVSVIIAKLLTHIYRNHTSAAARNENSNAVLQQDVNVAHKNYLSEITADINALNPEILLVDNDLDNLINHYNYIFWSIIPDHFKNFIQQHINTINQYITLNNQILSWVYKNFDIKAHNSSHELLQSSNKYFSYYIQLITALEQNYLLSMTEKKSLEQFFAGKMSIECLEKLIPYEVFDRIAQELKFTPHAINQASSGNFTYELKLNQHFITKKSILTSVPLTPKLDSKKIYFETSSNKIMIARGNSTRATDINSFKYRKNALSFQTLGKCLFNLFQNFSDQHLRLLTLILKYQYLQNNQNNQKDLNKLITDIKTKIDIVMPTAFSKKTIQSLLNNSLNLLELLNAFFYNIHHNEVEYSFELLLPNLTKSERLWVRNTLLSTQKSSNQSLMYRTIVTKLIPTFDYDDWKIYNAIKYTNNANYRLYLSIINEDIREANIKFITQFFTGKMSIECLRVLLGDQSKEYIAIRQIINQDMLDKVAIPLTTHQHFLNKQHAIILNDKIFKNDTKIYLDESVNGMSNNVIIKKYCLKNDALSTYVQTNKIRLIDNNASFFQKTALRGGQGAIKIAVGYDIQQPDHDCKVAKKIPHNSLVIERVKQQFEALTCDTENLEVSLNTNTQGLDTDKIFFLNTKNEKSIHFYMIYNHSAKKWEMKTINAILDKLKNDKKDDSIQDYVIKYYEKIFKDASWENIQKALTYNQLYSSITDYRIDKRFYQKTNIMAEYFLQNKTIFDELNIILPFPHANKFIMQFMEADDTISGNNLRQIANEWFILHITDIHNNYLNSNALNKHRDTKKDNLVVTRRDNNPIIISFDVDHVYSDCLPYTPRSIMLDNEVRQTYFNKKKQLGIDYKQKLDYITIAISKITTMLSLESKSIFRDIESIIQNLLKSESITQLSLKEKQKFYNKLHAQLKKKLSSYINPQLLPDILTAIINMYKLNNHIVSHADIKDCEVQIIDTWENMKKLLDKITTHKINFFILDKSEQK